MLTKNLPSATGIYQYKNIKTKIKERKVIKISPPKSERQKQKEAQGRRIHPVRLTVWFAFDRRENERTK